MKTVPIRKGATFFMYRVKDYVPAGGMGRVFRVHHTGWKVDLAMKQPRKKLFRNQKQKEAFADECKHWIELGLHPHIVSCFYVREINGIPSIFAEWMDGGSLKDWIYSKQDNRKPGRLYDGDEKEVRRQILDISIQFARGLHYAHRHNPEKVLIHQDVKPDNLLLTVDGRAKVLTAKVADFGIANARATIAYDEPDANINFSDGKSLTRNGKTCTPSYCSPEQQKGKDLTIRTDIWSWAVSVLEMFTGSRPWDNPYIEGGVIAGGECEYYFNLARIPIPEAMKDLLRWCFKYNEADRPKDFGVVATELLEIYQAETGNVYPRPEPKAASLTADSLNNRALSYLDLGEPENAEKCWEQALTVIQNHAECLYNRCIYLWKNARISDMDALRMLEENRSEITDYYMAKIHFERGDTVSTIEHLNKAKEAHCEMGDIQKMLVSAHKMIQEGNDEKCIKSYEEEYTGDSVCFSPDGKMLLMGSVLLDVSTLKCIQIFGEYKDYSRTTSCFNPEGNMIIIGDYKNTLLLWDVTTGQCVRSFTGHTGGITSVCFSPDGNTILSSDYDGMIKLWDVATGQNLHSFKGCESSWVESVKFSPDGKTAISGSDSSSLNLWNLKTGQRIHSFEGNRGQTVCFVPDGKMAIVSSGYDVKLLDVATGQCVRTYRGHKKNVATVCVSPDGKTFLSESQDDTLKWWDIHTGQCIRTFKMNDGMISGMVCFSVDGKIASSSNGWGRIKLWSIPKRIHCEMALSKVTITEKLLHDKMMFDTLTDEINNLIKEKSIKTALRRLKKMAKIPQYGISVEYFTLRDIVSHYCSFGKLTGLKTHIIHDGCGPSCFSPDGKMVISGSKGCMLKLWNIASGHCIRTFGGRYETGVKSVCFSRDGKTVVSGNWQGIIQLWDIMTGQCQRSIKAHDSWVTSICVSPDGRTIMSGSSDKSIKMWDIATMKCMDSYPSYINSPVPLPQKIAIGGIDSCITYLERTNEVVFVCFTPDGKKAIFLSKNNKPILWDRTTRQLKYMFKEYKYAISTISLSPDGKALLSAEPGSIFPLKLWDIETDHCIRIFQKGEFSNMMLVCISPDGKTAISSNWSGLLEVWDVATGQRIRTLEQNDSWCDSICFSPDGTKVVIGGTNKLIIYNLVYDLHFPGWHDWDEGARPYLEIFLTLYPNWTDDDFNNILIPDLQNKGYGWLRQGGVRAELEKMKLKEKEQHSF